MNILSKNQTFHSLTQVILAWFTFAFSSQYKTYSHGPLVTKNLIERNKSSLARATLACIELTKYFFFSFAIMTCQPQPTTRIHIHKLYHFTFFRKSIFNCICICFFKFSFCNCKSLTKESSYFLFTVTIRNAWIAIIILQIFCFHFFTKSNGSLLFWKRTFLFLVTKESAYPGMSRNCCALNLRA